MKYKLLSVHGKSATNIGDYVQALASSQFLPTLDGFVNREELSSYDGEECCIIMNGWFMHDPSQWPPSEKIHPLFVAFHMNSSASDGMLSESGIKYLKQNGPIGCRDINTMNLLTKHGIEAYFSACMTLTLGNNYYDKGNDGTVYFVDPIVPRSAKITEISKNMIYYLFHAQEVNKVAKKLYLEHALTLKRRIITAGFIRLYSRWFDKQIITEAEYISQENSYYKDHFNTDAERLAEAERLVRLYARAQLVVTNRIHCALPCLGLETPVVFVSDAKAAEISTCRFGGLIDLFNVMECNPDGLTPKFHLQGKITAANIPNNKKMWKDYAQHLSTVCKEFVINNKQ